MDFVVEIVANPNIEDWNKLLVLLVVALLALLVCETEWRQWDRIVLEKRALDKQSIQVERVLRSAIDPKGGRSSSLVCFEG